MATSYLYSEWNNIALGSSVLQQHDIFKAIFIAAGWRLKPDGTNESRSTSMPWFDVVPPVSESIGNAVGYQFLRITSTDATGSPANSIIFTPYVRYNIALPQTWMCSNKTTQTDAATLSVTINGATVSYTGVAGATSKQNLFGLYLAMRDSVNANFTAFDIYYDPAPPQRATSDFDVICMKQKVPAANSTITATNVDVSSSGNYQAAGTEFTRTDRNYASTPQSMVVDLVSGWTYYISLSKRGVTLGGKTGAGLIGPLMAGWRNNADAIAAIPKPKKIPWDLMPLELFVTKGAAYTASNDGSLAIYPSFDYGYAVNPTVITGVFSYDSNGARFRDCWLHNMKVYSGYTGSYGMVPVWSGSQIPTIGAANTSESQTVDDYQIMKPVLSAPACGTWSLDAMNNVPAGDLGDIWRYLGTSPNESSILVGDPEIPGTTLTTAIDGTSAITTIDVADASNLRSSGYVIINKRECFSYLGKTGNQLTGVTREQFKVPSKTKHYVGDSVRQGRFFVNINGAALDWGYSLPV